LRTAILLCVVSVSAFVLGSTSRAEDVARATESERVFVGRSGDTFRVPAAETTCKVSAEGGKSNVICHHVPQHRYDVYFYRSNILVFRVGQPDKVVFSAKGRP
jgi:hypothetical protein